MVFVVCTSGGAVVARSDGDRVADRPVRHRLASGCERNTGLAEDVFAKVELGDVVFPRERIRHAAGRFRNYRFRVPERHGVFARAAAYECGPVVPAPAHHNFARDERTTFAYGRECVCDIAIGVFSCYGLRLPVGAGSGYDRKRAMIAGEIDPCCGGGIMYAPSGVPFAVPHGDESVGDVWIMPDQSDLLDDGLHGIGL